MGTAELTNGMPLLLDARATAAALRISERTLFRLVKAGAIRPVHIGRALRFDPHDLRLFIERQKGESPALAVAEGGGP